MITIAEMLVRCGRCWCSSYEWWFSNAINYSNGSGYGSCHVNDMLIRCVLGYSYQWHYLFVLLCYCFRVHNGDNKNKDTRNESNSCTRASTHHCLASSRLAARYLTQVLMVVSAHLHIICGGSRGILSRALQVAFRTLTLRAPHHNITYTPRRHHNVCRPNTITTRRSWILTPAPS